MFNIRDIFLVIVVIRISNYIHMELRSALRTVDFGKLNLASTFCKCLQLVYSVLNITLII